MPPKPIATFSQDPRLLSITFNKDSHTSALLFLSVHWFSVEPISMKRTGFFNEVGP